MSGIHRPADSIHMDLNTLLDLDVVAVESEDQVSVLLEMAAPGAIQRTAAPGHASGRARPQRLDGRRPPRGRKGRARGPVARLDPTDSFGLVTFDDTIEVAIPAGPLADKDLARHVIAPSGPDRPPTSRAATPRRQEARRVAGDRGATLLLLSDGHANVGVIDHGELEQVAAARGAEAPPPPRSGSASATTRRSCDDRPRRRGQHPLRRGGRQRRSRGRVRGRRAARPGGSGREPHRPPHGRRRSVTCSTTSRPPRSRTASWPSSATSMPARSAGCCSRSTCRRCRGWACAGLRARAALRRGRLAEHETVTIPVHVNVVPGDQAAGRSRTRR